MSNTAVCLILTSALLHSLINLLIKDATSKVAFVWTYRVIAAVLFLPIVGVFYAEGWADIDAFVLKLGLLSGGIHFLYLLLLAKTYTSCELSYAYPIIRSSPALVLVVSYWLFDQSVSLLGCVGILFIVLGAYAINLEEMNIASLVEPVRSIASNRHTRLAYLTMVCATAYYIVDSEGVSVGAHPVILIGLQFLFSGTLMSFYCVGSAEASRAVAEVRRNTAKILICAAAGIASYLLVLVAFRMGKTSYVVGLRQVSVLFGVLAGGYIFKESNRLMRLVMASLIFIGAFLISIAE